MRWMYALAGMLAGAWIMAIADDVQHALSCSKITTRVTATTDPVAHVHGSEDGR